MCAPQGDTEGRCGSGYLPCDCRYPVDGQWCLSQQIRTRAGIKL